MSRLCASILLGAASLAAGCTAVEGPPRLPEARTWYPDADGDGFGDGAAPLVSPKPPLGGYVDNLGDCDDTRPDVHPGAVDVPFDGVDQDCRGGDADCENRAVYPGDLELRGEQAADLLGSFCSEFSGVAGTLTVVGTSWERLDPVLQCLCSLHQVQLLDNPLLEDVSMLADWALEGPAPSLEVVLQPRLRELVGPRMGHGARVVIFENHALARVSGFAGVDALRELRIGGRSLAEIGGFPDLRSAGVVEVSAGEEPYTLGAFRRLVEVEDLHLYDFGAVMQTRDLAALERAGVLSLDWIAEGALADLTRLREVADLRLANTALVDLDDVAGWRPRAISLSWNRDLVSIAGLGPVTELDRLFVAGPVGFGLEPLAGVTRVRGDLQLDFTDLASVDVLEGLTDIEGSLRITATVALPTLAGLEGLRRVGGDVIVADNQVLTDITALLNLESVGGMVFVDDNPGLPALDRQRVVEHLESVQTGP